MSTSAAIELLAVEDFETREAARHLIAEYLRWIASYAAVNYGLSFDIDAMVKSDARSIGYQVIRLESLKFLSAAHALYRSVGFVEIPPYAENSMKEYQPAETTDTYRSSAVFMELRFQRHEMK
jgi:hypothetical protein